MELNDIYIIIPAFDEDTEVLYQVISKFADHNLVVVDDGSKISVKESLRKYKTPPTLQIIKHDSNQGQGAAIQTGVHFAYQLGAEVFCTVDGDGQHDYESFEGAINEFSSGKYDIILGSRFLNKRSKVPVLKKIFLKGGILINYYYSGLLLNDAHCGLRVFGRKFAEKVSFFNKRQAHASEVLWLIKKYGFSFREFPVKIIYSDYSVKKGQSVWNSFNILVDLIKHKFSKTQ